MKLIPKLFILILFALVNTQFACNKENKAKVQRGIGEIYFTGDYAVDGCGFFIEINGEEYKPENEQSLHEEYAISGRTTVFIEYILLSEKIEVACGFSGLIQYNGINIISIETFER